MDSNQHKGRLRAVDLMTGGMAAPDAVDEHTPSFGWRIAGENVLGQRAYQIRATRTPSGKRDPSDLMWDSGRVESHDTVGIQYEGRTLEPYTRYWWSVRLWDERDRDSGWAEPATYRTSRLSHGTWTAPWISAPEELRVASGTGRVFYFGHSFQVEQPAVAAHLYATARGIYRVNLNGGAVDVGELAPGWTAYQRRFHYQVADVLAHLVDGQNRITLAVAPGWWSGNVAWWGRNIYGDHGSISVELRITFESGEEAIVSSGDAWKVALGRVIESDLIHGESQDLRQPGLGEDCLALKDSTSVTAEVEPSPAAKIVAEPQECVAVVETLQPASVSKAAGNHTIVDFGRHFTGRVRLTTSGEAARVLTMRHAEALNPDGSLYTANLRTARQQDVYVLGGTGQEVLTPEFALHGFRYVDVTGLARRAVAKDIVAEVVHSDLPLTGDFHSRNELVERLQQSVVWSQRSNFVAIPVDCHQRDERLGWTGDINLFAPTALFNMDCTRFLRSWLRALADCQLANGSIPDIAPYTDQPLPPRDIQDGQPGWGDAVVGIPWELYLHTGDPSTLHEFWEAMAAWMSYVQGKDKGVIRSGGVFGDWNALGRGTPSEIIGTAWFARSARTMSRAARAIGRKSDSRYYQDLFKRIRTVFQERFVTEDGRVQGETQTAYALALHSNLVPEGVRYQAVEHLVDTIKACEWHLSTGFLGTACILQALSDGGRSDVAYRLLLERTYPSWGFELDHGATTLWEHWDSWRPETGFHDPKMNSFNHYSFATVGAWLYRYVAGINPDPERPGYRRILFRPHPNQELGDASATLYAVSGLVSSGWRVEGEQVRLRLEVPPNCEGTLELPWLSEESGILSYEATQVRRVIRSTNGRLGLTLGPGVHKLTTSC